MAHEDLRRQHGIEGSSDRSFGLVFAAVFLLVAGWPLFRGEMPRWWALVAAALFGLVALTKPAVGDFLDSVTANHLELGFEQLEVESVSSLVGRKLSETVIRSELNIVVVSIRRNDGEIIFNPSGETKIENGDMLIAIGNAESLTRLNALAHGQATQPRAIEAETK